MKKISLLLIVIYLCFLTACKDIDISEPSVLATTATTSVTVQSEIVQEPTQETNAETLPSVEIDEAIANETKSEDRVNPQAESTPAPSDVPIQDYSNNSAEETETISHEGMTDLH